MTRNAFAACLAMAPRFAQIQRGYTISTARCSIRLRSNENGAKTSIDAWGTLITTVDCVCKHWDQADGGIWEFRNSKSHFLYSRLMCWVAIDRAHRLAVKRSLPAQLVRWAKVRDDTQLGSQC